MNRFHVKLHKKLKKKIDSQVSKVKGISAVKMTL